MAKCSVCGSDLKGNIPTCPVCGMKTCADIEAFKTLMPAKAEDARILLLHRKKYQAAGKAKQEKTVSGAAGKSTGSAAEKTADIRAEKKEDQKKNTRQDRTDIYRNLASCFTGNAVIYGAGGQPLTESMRFWASKTLAFGRMQPQEAESVVAISASARENKVTQGMVFTSMDQVWINVRKGKSSSTNWYCLDLDSLISIEMLNLRTCRLRMRTAGMEKTVKLVFPPAVDLRRLILFLVSLVKNRSGREIQGMVMTDAQLDAYRKKQKAKAWSWGIIALFSLIILAVSASIMEPAAVTVFSFLLVIGIIKVCTADVRYQRSI